MIFVADKTIKLWRLSERPKQAKDSNICRSAAGVSGEPDEAMVEKVDVRNKVEEKTEDGCKGPFSCAGSQFKVFNAGDLRVPRFDHCAGIFVVAQPRRVFSNAHAYHINSISVNSDQETFLSADDLRINLWNLNVTNQSFSKVTLRATFESVLTSNHRYLVENYFILK